MESAALKRTCYHPAHAKTCLALLRRRRGRRALGADALGRRLDRPGRRDPEALPGHRTDRFDQPADHADRRGEALGLTEDEVAFYDALETNDSAVKVLGDQTLRTIAQELLKTIRNNITIDWTVRENVRAQMRVMTKRILRRYGYPPDKQARATELVLEQAEVLSRDWAEKG